MNSREYYSSGKLLLSGEYLVLCGAEALAVPLNIGQRMTVISHNPGSIQWKTKVLDQDWFSGEFRLPGLEIMDASDKRVATVLKTLLAAGESLKPGFFSTHQGWQINSRLEFDIRWGLGSSSSLVSNIAYWMDIDPYQLFRKVYPGSGYDVFCARAKRPILFYLEGETPIVSETGFKPPFLENLFFVYLGKKQDSQISVEKFRSGALVSQKNISAVTRLTRKMVLAATLQDFIEVMKEHEELLSSLLALQTVGRSRFPDFPGAVKSLGAWGGDFILAASSEPAEVVVDYFKGKGLDVIFRYHELAL